MTSPITRREMLLASGFAGVSMLLPTSVSAVLRADQFPEDATPGGTLIVGLATDPQTLNPATTTSSSTQVVAGALFDSLLIYDRDMQPQPNLAESWDVSDDSTSYTFHLVQGVSWHDGEPFTSADVKFTAENVWRELHSRNKLVLSNLDRVDTPDDYTAVFLFREPYAALLSSLGKYDGSIIPRHLFEGTEISDNPYGTETPVGTGPFVFQEWAKGDHVTVVRNPAYWRADQPYLEQVVFQILPNPPARGLALEAGTVDYLPFPVLPPLSEVARVQGSEGIAVDQVPDYILSGKSVIMFNLRREITGNQLVRHAVAHAMDRDFMAQSIMFGFAQPAEGPFSPPWYDDDAVRKYPFDIDRANALLDEAGYPREGDGPRFSLGLSYDTARYASAKTAELMKAQLLEVGIDIQLQGTDRATSEQAQFMTHDFDLGIPAEFPATGPDPSVGIRSYYHSANIGEALYNNAAAYQNPEVDVLFDEAGATTDVERRGQLFSDVQTHITRDLPYIWVMKPAGVVLYRDAYANILWTDPYEVDYGSIYLEGTSS